LRSGTHHRAAAKAGISERPLARPLEGLAVLLLEDNFIVALEVQELLPWVLPQWCAPGHRPQATAVCDARHQSGVRAIVTKPFDRDSLRIAISQSLKKGRT